MILATNYTNFHEFLAPPKSGGSRGCLKSDLSTNFTNFTNFIFW